MKIEKLTPVFCPECLPDNGDIEAGLLYICLRYNSTTHLCACGCGEVTYLNTNQPDGWQYSQREDEHGNILVSLSPSIQQRMPCKAHYHITDNRIVWC